MKALDRIVSLVCAAVLALLFYPTAALAQTVTAQIPPAKCEPKQISGSKATGEFLTVRGTDEHIVFMWACPSAGAWEYEDFIWRYGYLPELPSLTDIASMGFFAAMWKANMTAMPVTDAERQTAMDARIALMAKLPPAPPAPRWSVAPNGTYPTRPVYTLAADGKLTLTSLRVDVLTAGTPTLCDCRIASTAPDKTPRYCAIPQPYGTTPARVAVCRLQ